MQAGLHDQSDAKDVHAHHTSGGGKADKKADAPQAGPGCQLSCSLAVSNDAAPAAAQRIESALAFRAFAQNLEDYLPERLVKPPKSLRA